MFGGRTIAFTQAAKFDEKCHSTAKETRKAHDNCAKGVPMEKTAIRKQMLQLRSQLRPRFIEDSARRMGGQIAALPAFRDANLVMLYHSYHNEADTMPLLNYCLKIHKRAALPVTDDDFCLHAYELVRLGQLRSGSMGIPEPNPELCSLVDPSSIDLIVVPGAAFDVNGGRIGYGKGCYDRFLPQLRPDALVIGLAYDFQVLSRVPQSAGDRKVDLIVTEKGILELS